MHKASNIGCNEANSCNEVNSQKVLSLVHRASTIGCNEFTSCNEVNSQNVLLSYAQSFKYWL